MLREYGKPIDLLDKAIIVNLDHNYIDPSSITNLNLVDTTFKYYIGNAGFLVSLTYQNIYHLDNDTYQVIFQDKLYINEGMNIENIVTQILRSKDDKIYFYAQTIKQMKKQK